MRMYSRRSPLRRPMKHGPGGILDASLAVDSHKCETVVSAVPIQCEQRCLEQRHGIWRSERRDLLHDAALRVVHGEAGLAERPSSLHGDMCRRATCRALLCLLAVASFLDTNAVPPRHPIRRGLWSLASRLRLPLQQSHRPLARQVLTARPLASSFTLLAFRERSSGKSSLR